MDSNEFFCTRAQPKNSYADMQYERSTMPSTPPNSFNEASRASAEKKGKETKHKTNFLKYSSTKSIVDILY